MDRLRLIFFPMGKHHINYGRYISWSFLSNAAVSAESAMSVHSMLTAVDTGSDAIRTANYIGKDIIGQLGGLGYMAHMGRKADAEPRKFLLYSNAIQQAAYLITCVTPLAPEYFLPLAGCANILINLSFAGFGAINAKCIQTLAEEDNIGEIYAKISMTNMIGSSLGLLVGLGLVFVIPDHYSRLYTLPVLAVIRVYTLNKAIEGLVKR